MKNILLITITILTFLSCKAQQPVIALFNGSDYLLTENAYYKDTDGDLAKLIGTWQYTNGNESLKIILKMRSQNLTEFTTPNFSCYEDILYGEFKYINQNGLQIINSINQIDLNQDPYEHSIYGGYIIDNNDLPTCNDCEDNERRVKVVVKDPLRPYFDYGMIIRHFSGDALFDIPEQIIIKIKRSATAIVPEGQPGNDRITFDEITLNKQ